MADDNLQVDDSQVDGDGQVDNNNEAEPVKSESEFMEETVDFIKDTQKQILDEEDDKQGSADNSGVMPELRGTDIPDAFSDAAEAAGMSKEDIIAMADKHTDDELMEMIPTLEASLKEDDKDNDKKVHKDVDETDDKVNKDVDKKEIDPELVKQITESISNQLKEQFGATLEEINKFRVYQEKQSQKQTLDRASKLLDEASKEFPVFGKTDELPVFPSGRLKGQLIPTSPEVKARLEVLRYADIFMKTEANIDDAMAKALATYKGLHLEKELERKQVRDLKAREKTLSGARVGKETSKKHLDSRDEIIDEIRQMQKAAGVDV